MLNFKFKFGLTGTVKFKGEGANLVGPTSK
jgi:hypothetical protein